MHCPSLSQVEGKTGLVSVCCFGPPALPKPRLTVTDIAGLQDPDSGSFAGDIWGEKDTRFIHCAFIALSVLDSMSLVDVESAVKHIQQSANLDGAYGTSPGAESHSGQVFTCVGALSIAGRLDLVDADRLGAWLSERQLPNGGLNGRPEKLEDVCYSWWVLSSLAMIERLHWIDGGKLSSFILKCQVCIPRLWPDPWLIGRRMRKMEAFLIVQVIWWMFFTLSLA